jgi:DNA-binding IclR family transcriptional regulator
MKDNLLARGISIIEKLAEKGPRTVEELFQETQIARSSIYRILCTLESIGYVIRFRDGVMDSWDIDLKVLNISSNILHRTDVKTKIRDLLVGLANTTKEIVQLGVLHKNNVMILDVIRLHKSIVNVATIGEYIPINVCAAGLAICAYLEPAELRNLLDTTHFPQYTEHTVTERDKLLSLFETIRRQGYSLDDQYFAIGHRCIGAPVFDNTGRVLAGINISGHISTIHDERIDELAEQVKQCAYKASKRMGYQSSGYDVLTDTD